MLERLRRRAGDPRWDTIVAAILLQRDAGGDLARLLRTIATAQEEAARVEADARGLTSQARFTAWLVSLLPLGAAALAELGQPGYLLSLARDPLTAVLLLGAIVCQLVAGALLRPPHRAAARHVSAALVLALAAALLAAAGLGEAATAGPPRRVRARVTRPAVRRRGALVAALGRLGARLGAPAPPADLARRLAAAGAPSSLRVGDVMAVKAGAALVALLAALPLAAAAPGRLGPVLAVAGPAGAFLVPDLWLARRTAARRRVMAAELPDVLDLLRVAVDAGLSPARALAEVGRHRRGLLAAELRATAARIDLGVARADALHELGRRCPVDAIAPLVAALLRAERHGAPLGPALAALAADARAAHAVRLREHAARAAPKIQLVVALLLVPAVMLLVGAALADALR